MAKFQLEVDYNYDFELIGISCHTRDYRLAWSINKQLNIALKKEKEDYDLKGKRQKEATHHSWYTYFDPEDHIEYSLLLNKSGNSIILPEHKSVDYLLIIKNNFQTELNDIVEKIKTIESVLTAFEIPVEGLKSKENLIL